MPRKVDQPWSSMDRLSPDFALTFLPGFSTVPRAPFVMFFTDRSSTQIVPYLSARSVLSLCRKSFLQHAIRWCSRVIRSFCFFQLAENFTFRASSLCSLASFVSRRLKEFMGNTYVPSEQVQKRE